jgi:hypothetical protein
LVAGIGAGVFWGFGPEEVALPPAPAKTAVRTAIEAPFPEIALLSGPWYRLETMPVSPATSPQPAAPPVPSDTSSLTYVGSYSQQDGSIAYFFKDKRSSQVLILKPGQVFKGWTLDGILAKTFIVIGPGGRYEVPR